MMTESGPSEQFAADLAELARVLHSAGAGAEPDILQVLAEITGHAMSHVPGVDHAGISLVRRRNNRRTITSAAPTDDVAEKLDELQEAADDGPCLDAIRQHRTVRIDDLDTEERWSGFIAAARQQTSVRSSLSIQLYVENDEQGALNLYSHEPDNFSPDVTTQALTLGAHAAVGLSGANRTEQFRAALASRDMIGQAKGVIMERYDIDENQAFELLKRLSQDSNMGVAELARRLVHTDHPPR